MKRAAISIIMTIVLGANGLFAADEKNVSTQSTTVKTAGQGKVDGASLAVVIGVIAAMAIVATKKSEKANSTAKEQEKVLLSSLR